MALAGRSRLGQINSSCPDAWLAIVAGPGKDDKIPFAQLRMFAERVRAQLEAQLAKSVRGLHAAGPISERITGANQIDQRRETLGSIL